MVALMSDQSPDHVVFTIGRKAIPVPLISFADAKRHSLVGPPELIAHVEKVCTLLAPLLSTEEKPVMAEFLMEALSLGEALDLPKRWDELMQRSGMPVPIARPQAPPLPEMPSVSVALPEQGLGPNFPAVDPPAAG